jgi:hypothetical protein
MMKLMCGSTECTHNDKCKCTLDFVSMRPVSVHAINNVWNKVWKCDYFEMSEEYKTKLGILGGNVRGTRQKEESEML